MLKNTNMMSNEYEHLTTTNTNTACHDEYNEYEHLTTTNTNTACHRPLHNIHFYENDSLQKKQYILENVYKCINLHHCIGYFKNNRY